MIPPEAEGSMQENIVALVSIVGAFTLAGLFWTLLARGQMRARELLHAERLAAIDKGLLPPLEVDFGASGESAVPGASKKKEDEMRALGMGLFWLLIGLGFILAMNVVYPGSTRWGWGIIVVFLGLAYLVGYWLARGKAAPDAAKREDDAQ